MSAFVCRVEQHHPLALVRLVGALEPQRVPEVEKTLRDCLAEMPAVLLIDMAHVSIASCSVLDWLRKLADDAAIWPGTPIYVCGNTAISEGCSLPGYESVRAAKQAWAGASTPPRRSLTLPPEPESCAQARAFVGRVCADWGIARPARLAQLLISELVANAVKHAHTKLAVTVRPFGKGIELSVRDDGDGKVPEKLPDDPRGFGLQLVDAMSEAWGSAPAGRGKVVWTRLPA